MVSESSGESESESCVSPSGGCDSDEWALGTFEASSDGAGTTGTRLLGDERESWFELEMSILSMVEGEKVACERPECDDGTGTSRGLGRGVGVTAGVTSCGVTPMVYVYSNVRTAGLETSGGEGMRVIDSQLQEQL